MSPWLEAGFATHRPRALAALTRVFRDIDLAEDAFADACLKAVSEWDRTGPPRDPFAWLLTTARNAGIDRLRTAGRRRAILERNAADFLPDPVPEPELPDPNEMRDDVLRLLFICCHPALARRDQLALALKVVAGLTVDEIARAFLVKPKTLEQRLTRAKRTVAANPVPFETPSPQERGRRLGEVSLMIYLMFNEGWSTSDSAEQVRLALCEEAIRLARLLVELFPAMSEQSALLALLLYQHARRAARVTADGQLRTLDEQDRALWDRAAIAEAHAHLQKAQRAGQNGPYRIQAAIAGEHARAARPEDTDWAAIVAHYDALAALQPTPVVRLNRAAAIARALGPEAALAELAPLADDLSEYRWFHTTRATLLAQIGNDQGARTAWQRALELGPTAPERLVIEEKIAALQKT